MFRDLTDVIRDKFSQEDPRLVAVETHSILASARVRRHVGIFPGYEFKMR